MASSSSDWPVHQLWPPPEGKQSTTLDVVLFHGLQLTANNTGDAWRSTWTQRGNDDGCWPEDWLPFDLGGAVRVYSVSYNAHAVTSPHDHVSEIAHNLFQSLMNPRYIWHYPIILIGHSFGGLVLKSLVVKLKRASTTQKPVNSWSKTMVKQAKVFLRNVRGVAFYAVPHAGSSNFAKYVSKLLRCNNRQHPGIMDNMQPWQRDMEQLSMDFHDIVDGNKINVYAFCEGRPMKKAGILVNFSSAQRLARDNTYMVEDADHMEVCKPPSKEHTSYSLLLEFINICQEAGRDCDPPLQEVHDLPHAMFGLDSYVERIENLVTSERIDAAPHYVGVWGMGGVGKTLLLQRVYGSPKVHDHFVGAKFIWRSVGQTPDVMSIYRSINAELNLGLKENEIGEVYKLKLFNCFRLKRVFLVLDDVWNDEAFVSLDLAKGEGSVLLLSTRNQSLLDRPTPHITQEHMTRLSEEDSWSLFCVHAFRLSSNVPCELVPLAQSIAKECQGLPLALKVIGRAVFELSLRKFEWVSLLKKLRESRMQERTVEEKLYERLKLGYDLLSEDDYRLKQCFHYFAAFPEDCNILFEEILFHWTGEGLVPAYDGDDPAADAFSLLKKLWKRSFIESNEQFDPDDGYLLTFKVHDVMRDLAFYLLKKEDGTDPARQLYLYQAGRNLDEIPKEWTKILEVVRLSLHTNNLKTLPQRFCAPKLVTLLLGHNLMFSLPTSFSSSFPKLSVLNLSNGKFRYLPEELGDLKNLVYLDLSDCLSLETLPDTIWKLRVLKFLILDNCKCLQYLPSGIIDLTSLEVLHTGGCCRLIWGLHTLSGRVRASLEDICGLSNLTELTICASANSLLQLPNNVSVLPKLKLLQVWFDIKPLPAALSHQCKELQEIDLIFSHLKYLPTTFTRCGAFPALKKLQLFHCDLVEFPEVNQGALPSLQTLDFTSCWHLESLPLSLELLTSLRKLIVADCVENLENCCRINCENSTIWRKFNIQYSDATTHDLRIRKYMFS